MKTRIWILVSVFEFLLIFAVDFVWCLGQFWDWHGKFGLRGGVLRDLTGMKPENEISKLADTYFRESIIKLLF